MKQIRKNVFETNSSSTHSITMCLESDYRLWELGQKYFYDSHYCLPESHSQFFTWDEMIDFLKNQLKLDEEEIKRLNNIQNSSHDELESFLSDYNFYTFSSYEEFFEYEQFEDMFTTPSGETVVAFGYYGND